MPNPKRRHSNSRTNKRRKSQKIEVVNLSVCPNCESRKPSHSVCPSCGYYKGMSVIDKTEKQKKEK